LCKEEKLSTMKSTENNFKRQNFPEKKGPLNNLNAFGKGSPSQSLLLGFIPYV